MFKYSTSTILNGYTGDITTFVDENGVQRITTDTTSGSEYINITRLGKFEKSAVQSIYYRPGTNGTAGTATITCATATNPSKGETATIAGVYRLKLYVKLSGNNDEFYANDMVFKGKPYVYEFAITNASATATDIATAAKEAIDKAGKRFNDTAFSVTQSDAVLTITTIGKDNVYRSITECTLQKFDATVNSALVGGEYIDVVVCSQDDTTNTLVPCVNPFGNYLELIKDLRIPTAENTGWTSLMQDEMPVAGVVYDQFIIYMSKNRGVMGGDAVGQPVQSVTAHSIWVPQTNAAAFKTLLANIGTVEDYK